MQRTGIVMDLEATTAIVLTNDGEFCKIPRTLDLILGEEVTWEAKPTPQTFGCSWRTGTHRASTARSVWVTATAAGLAACLMAGVALWEMVGDTQKAYAYVAVDISPSVKLTVDSHLRVISCEPTDADGQALLLKMSRHKRERLTTFIHDLVTTAVSTHMMPTDDHILVATAPAATNTATAVDAAVQHVAQSAVQSALQTNQSARDLHPQVVTIAMPQAVWRAADKLKVSPAKFATFVVARKKGLHVRLKDLDGGATMNQVLSQLSVATSESVSVDLKSAAELPVRVATTEHPLVYNDTGTQQSVSNVVGPHAVVGNTAGTKTTTANTLQTATVGAITGEGGTHSVHHPSGGPKHKSTPPPSHGSSGSKHHTAKPHGINVDVDENAVTALNQTSGSVVMVAVPQVPTVMSQPGQEQSSHGNGYGKSQDGESSHGKGNENHGKHPKDDKGLGSLNQTVNTAGQTATGLLNALSNATHTKPSATANGVAVGVSVGGLDITTSSTPPTGNAASANGEQTVNEGAGPAGGSSADGASNSVVSQLQLAAQSVTNTVVDGAQALSNSLDSGRHSTGHPNGRGNSDANGGENGARHQRGDAGNQAGGQSRIGKHTNQRGH